MGRVNSGIRKRDRSLDGFVMAVLAFPRSRLLLLMNFWPEPQTVAFCSGICVVQLVRQPSTPTIWRASWRWKCMMMAGGLYRAMKAVLCWVGSLVSPCQLSHSKNHTRLPFPLLHYPLVAVAFMHKLLTMKRFCSKLPLPRLHGRPSSVVIILQGMVVNCPLLPMVDY